MADEFLQKLVYEVYGAEEGVQKLEEFNKAEDKRKKSMKSLVRESKRLAKEEVKAAKASAREQEQAAKRVEEAQRKKAEAMKKYAAAGAAALALLAKAAFEASANMEEAVGRLERTASKAGASQGDLAKVTAEVDAESRKFGRSTLEQTKLLDELTSASGNLITAKTDLALANDIAATGDMEAAQAATALAKARKGEIEELKQLDGFTKTQIQNLSQITDDADRGAAAIAILAGEYSGASGELAGMNDAMSNLEEAGNDLLAVIGDATGGLFNAFSEWLGLIRPGGSLLDSFAVGMRNFAKAAEEVVEPLLDLVDLSLSGGFVGQALRGEEIGVGAHLSKRDTERALEAKAKDDVAKAKADKPEEAPVYGPSISPAEIEKKAAEAQKAREKEAADAAKAKAEAAREFEKAEQERERAAQERWEAQMDRLQQSRDEEAKKADEAAKNAEKVAKAEAKAAETKAKEIQEWEKGQAEYIRRLRNNEAAGRQKDEAAKEAASEKQMETYDALASGATALAGSFIKDEQAKAAVQVLIEGARATAAFASGNIPGGIAHGVAAAQFAIAAATSSGGGGGAGGAKGIQKRAKKAPAPKPREDAQLIHEKGPSSSAPAGINIQYNSVWPPSPQQVKETRRLLDSDRRGDV